MPSPFDPRPVSSSLRSFVPALLGLLAVPALVLPGPAACARRDAAQAEAGPPEPESQRAALQRGSTGPSPWFPRGELARERRALTRVGAAATETCSVPTAGAQRILVLPVIVDDYATVPAAVDSAPKLHDFLFGTPQGRQTLTSYFAASSRGAAGGPLLLEGDVMEWRRIAHSNGESTVTDGKELATAADPIVQRALAAFDPDVDYAKYDANGDGCIDWVMVVHSGPDQAMTRNPKDVWSHFEYYPPGDRATYDGKRAWSASVVSARAPIGVFAHEFAHNLGLPDLYSSGPPNKSIVGYWSLMDEGMWSGPELLKGTAPTGIDAYGLALLGWAAPVSVTSSRAGVPVGTSASSAPDVLQIPLAPLGSPPARHYLLVEGRRNASARGGAGFLDDALSGSGVLVWEVDEGGRNAFGELRQAVTVANAYPGEPVRGIAPEALLTHAPFLPPAPGVASVYEAHGVRLAVTSSTSDGYVVSVAVDPAPRAELKARLVRVTSDPHAVGGTLAVRAEVVNVGGATAHGVLAQIAPQPGLAWGQPVLRLLGTLAPGGTASADWTGQLTAAGHLDLFVAIGADDAARAVVRDKAYVDGKLSAFDSLSISLGAHHALHAPAAWDHELKACLVDNGAPDLGPAACKGASPPPACTPCAQYTAGRPPVFDADFCPVIGGYHPCRGEVVGLWAEDFDGDGVQELLVQSRDQTDYIRCTVEQCPRSGVVWVQLALYKWQAGALQQIWELAPAESPVQPGSCAGGLWIVPKVVTLAGKKGILVSNFCNGASVLYQADGAGGMAATTFASGPPLPFDPGMVLAQGADFGGSGKEDLLVVEWSGPPLQAEPRLVHVGSAGAIPTFSAGEKLMDLFGAAYEARFGAGARINFWVDGTYMGPKAFFADVDGDGSPDLVLADGNGIDTGRILVFGWEGGDRSRPRLQVLRDRWKNGTTQLVPFDWDGDGSPEIVATNSSDNSLSVFKWVPGVGEYRQIFEDSFGGYTGSGYNPSLAIGDVDGNGTQDVVLGEGGHCSVPTVGSGVYVYGYGMVLSDGDLNGDGIAERDPGMGIFSTAVGDLDGDGKAEIAAGSQTGYLYVLHHRQIDSSQPALTGVKP